MYKQVHDTAGSQANKPIELQQKKRAKTKGKGKETETEK